MLRKPLAQGILPKPTNENYAKDLFLANIIHNTKFYSHNDDSTLIS